MKKYKYDLFISYSHDDEKWVEGLKNIIEAKIRHPITKKKLEIFRDRESLIAGLNWKKQLEQALYDSACVLAVLSPSYANSEYTKWEWDFMEVEDILGLRGRVLPLLLKKDPTLDSLTRLRQYRDFCGASKLNSKSFMKIFNYLANDIKSILSTI